MLNNQKIASAMILIFGLVAGIVAAMYLPLGNDTVRVDFTVKNNFLGGPEFTNAEAHFVKHTLINTDYTKTSLLNINIPFIESSDLTIIASSGSHRGSATIDGILIGQTSEGTVYVNSVPTYSSHVTITLYDDNSKIIDTMEVDIV